MQNTIKAFIFISISLISLFAGVLVPVSQARRLFELSGYYFIFTASLLWSVAFVRAHCHDFTTTLKKHGLLLLLCVLFTGLIFVKSPPQYKVLADEANLMGTSMMMFYEKISAVALKGFFYDYGVTEYEYMIGRRPLLFPFLISVAHSIFGYSPANGFVLNFFTAVAILFSFHVLISRCFDRTVGIVSILMFASVPQFVFCVTSSGFEALNVLFIILNLLTLHQFIKDQSVVNAELFLFTTLLSAHCRYESALFVILVATVIPFVKRREMVFDFSPRDLRDSVVMHPASVAAKGLCGYHSFKQNIAHFISFSRSAFRPFPLSCQLFEKYLRAPGNRSELRLFMDRRRPSRCRRLSVFPPTPSEQWRPKECRHPYDHIRHNFFFRSLSLNLRLFLGQLYNWGKQQNIPVIPPLHTDSGNLFHQSRDPE